MSGSSTAGAAQDPWLFHGPAAPRGTALPPDAVGLPDAVLFDRDGTLVVDVPYNGDPTRVVPMPSAVEALAAVRALGIRVGVVSNQSGVARGMLTPRQVAAVQRRVDAFLGPFDIWAVCPHGPDDGCRCRKPAPGLVLAACEALGVCPARTAVIGDIGSDVAAALAAGARGVLVPTPATLPEEIAAAPDTAPDLLRAVRLVLDPSARCHRPTAPPRHRSPAPPARLAPARGPAPGGAPTPDAAVAAGRAVAVRADGPGPVVVAAAGLPAGAVALPAVAPVGGAAGAAAAGAAGGGPPRVGGPAAWQGDGVVVEEGR
ncbi:D-glycero-alpha-D-manno-heptose-1,7-bisphosphate 7-phosphatase [Streptomyces peucetius]|uniref:D-glycero-alpha-D-manno-heptose-1,7-bisphosphate 7-phosphatase n=1 Tax=Streptomyces peucetius TaxID=1950 RepID=UPI0039AF20EE